MQHDPPSILLHLRTPHLSASLRNYLLSGGYPRVVGVATAKAVLAELRSRDYGYVLIELVDPIKRGEWMAQAIALRWPRLRVIVLVDGAALSQVRKNRRYCVVIKEYVFSNLLQSMSAGSHEAEHKNSEQEK